MRNSSIEWTDHTFNPHIGCTKVSPGCDNCYAEARMDKRLHKVQWGPGQPRQRTSEAYWKQPLTWNADHETFFAEHGRRQRVFCASLADVFDNEVDPQWRADLFDLILKTPNLDWLLLTKRIGNVWKMMADACGVSMASALLPLPNVWLGATIVNQEEADRDIPKLLATPAAKRFLSMEPLLGPVGLGFMDPCDHHRRSCEEVRCWNALDWVIVGGESGPGARPMHPDWARSLRDQCQAAGVPYFFKQWGEWLPWHHFGDAAVNDPPEQTRFDTREWRDGTWHDAGKPDFWDTMGGEIDDTQCVGRVGKKAAGRLLDGRTWDEVPA
jgi:protein gp37